MSQEHVERTPAVHQGTIRSGALMKSHQVVVVSLSDPTINAIRNTYKCGL